MTVLVTTHYMDEAEQCDRLAFILDGKIIADGAPPDLKQDLATRIFEADVSGDPFEPLAAVQGHAGLEDAYLFGRRLRVVAQRRPRSRGARRHRPLRRAPPGRALARGRLRLARPQARPTAGKVTA